ncbi:hypothetical protein AUQ48_11960 [Kocuria flava]|uniref:Uncharacterized protein n=1 Tax=Kocuria flava TaxID=446860 RepID=A0A2N4T3J4_9MICC|nr:hypothetical protein [Kocuria flava]PLC12808.1 hypothetical protein AUQ48_11960 [Kocuria flava]
MQTPNITDAVEAAARAQYERAAQPGAPRWEDCAESDRAIYRIAVRPHIEVAAPFIAARSLQDAATAFATTRPTEAARRSLEYPVVELQAMAYRHTAVQRPVVVPPSAVVTAPAAAASAPRWVRAVLGALRPSRSPETA